MNREKLIDIFAIEGFDYAKALSIIDKILALSEPTLGEEEIAKIVNRLLLDKSDIFLNCAKDCEIHKCHSGMWTLLTFTAEEISKALSGRIARPEEEPSITVSVLGDEEGNLKTPITIDDILIETLGVYKINNRRYWIVRDNVKKPQELKCTCPNGENSYINCPTHGQQNKKGKIKLLNESSYCLHDVVKKVNEIIDVVNKHREEER